jgi:8-oxo-dGTP diphosphatase
MNEQHDNVPYIRLTGADTPRSDEDVVCFRAVTAVVRHWSEDKYLFVKFCDGVWGLVGGKVERGESHDAAVMRELEEETIYKNFAIEEVLFHKAFSRGYKTRKDQEEECEERIYLVRALDDERSADIAEEEGISEWAWLTKEEALTKEMLSHHKFYFQKALVEIGDQVRWDDTEVTGVGVIFAHDDAAILQKRDMSAHNAPGKIALFGGGREGLEAPIVCLEREVQEEVGIVLDDGKYDIAILCDTINTSVAHDDKVRIYVVRGVSQSAMEVSEGESAVSVHLGDDLKNVMPFSVEMLALYWHVGAQDGVQL